MPAEDLGRLDAARGIADPVERARVLSDLRGHYERLVAEAAAMRREAIGEALASGMTQDQLARALGVTPGRISQMRRARDTEAPVIETGWLADDPGRPVAHIAICGSRAPGSSAEHVDAAVPALAGLLMRQRYLVSIGPVGIGAEVLTYIADQHRPPGLDRTPGIIGHANVIRDARYILVIGGGAGTQAETDMALTAGKRLLPMPLSGGTAARVYMRQLGDPALRAWLPDATFSALATADAAQFAAIAETVLAEGGEP
jgi:hypothetical protein